MDRFRREDGSIRTETAIGAGRLARSRMLREAAGLRPGRPVSWDEEPECDPSASWLAMRAGLQ